MVALYLLIVYQGNILKYFREICFIQNTPSADSSRQEGYPGLQIISAIV